MSWKHTFSVVSRVSYSVRRVSSKLHASAPELITSHLSVVSVSSDVDGLILLSALVVLTRDSPLSVNASLLWLSGTIIVTYYEPALGKEDLRQYVLRIRITGRLHLDEELI